MFTVQNIAAQTVGKTTVPVNIQYIAEKSDP